MSLGENLQFLRKTQNITQEQLAEALDVSRQSISKWESDSTYPEMDKLLQIAKMFHCSLDDLTQKDISTRYVEDKNNYDKHKNRIGKMTTIGVGLIMIGLTFLIGLYSILPQTERYDYLGVLVFFIFLVIAVAILVVAGMQDDYFEKKYPFIENFYTESEKDEFQKKNTMLHTAGVVSILLGLIVMMGIYFIFPDVEQMGRNIDMEGLVGCVFFLFVTISVILFVYAGMQEDKYNIDHYNEMHDPESDAYKKAKKSRRAYGIIMMLATIVFLLIGFLWNLWQHAPLIYGIAGILCGIARVIIKNISIKK